MLTSMNLVTTKTSDLRIIENNKLMMIRILMVISVIIENIKWNTISDMTRKRTITEVVRVPRIFPDTNITPFACVALILPMIRDSSRDIQYLTVK